MVPGAHLPHFRTGNSCGQFNGLRDDLILRASRAFARHPRQFCTFLQE
jgi:hypothetical protein